MAPTTRLQSRGGDTPSAKSSLNESKSDKKGKARKGGKFTLTAIHVVSLGALAATLAIAGCSYLIYKDMVKLSGNTKPQELSTYVSRFEFTARYQVLGMTMLILSSVAVMIKRCTTHAIDPMAGYEYITQQSRNVLTNSLESFVMSSITQLIAISYLTPPLTMKIIPAVNIFFFVGRIAFWIGYPKYRTFGVVLTITPTLLLNAFNLYKLGAHLNLY